MNEQNLLNLIQPNPFIQQRSAPTNISQLLHLNQISSADTEFPQDIESTFAVAAHTETPSLQLTRQAGLHAPAQKTNTCTPTPKLAQCDSPHLELGAETDSNANDFAKDVSLESNAKVAPTLLVTDLEGDRAETKYHAADHALTPAKSPPPPPPPPPPPLHASPQSGNTHRTSTIASQAARAFAEAHATETGRSGSSSGQSAGKVGATSGVEPMDVLSTEVLHPLPPKPHVAVMNKHSLEGTSTVLLC